jgi:hypothetical protein
MIHSRHLQLVLRIKTEVLVRQGLSHRPLEMVTSSSPCSPVKANRRFGQIHWPLQRKQETGMKRAENRIAFHYFFSFTYLGEIHYLLKDQLLDFLCLYECCSGHFFWSSTSTISRNSFHSYVITDNVDRFNKRFHWCSVKIVKWFECSYNFSHN